MISLKSPGDILQEISILVRRQRLTRNLTQADLAECSGVSLAVLRKFERTGKVSLESFMKLLFVLGLLDTLLDVLKPGAKPFSSMDELLGESTKIICKRASSRGK